MFKKFIIKSEAKIISKLMGNKIFHNFLEKNKCKNDNESIYKIYKTIFDSTLEKSEIKLDSIGKVYEGGFKAIHDFNLNIKKGEFVSLLGPSGCGKTTILRMIAGLELISEGSLLMNDVVVNSALPKDRNLAMVFQNYALYPYMNVYNNIAFGLKNVTYTNGFSEEILDKLMAYIYPNYLDIKYLKIQIKNEMHINKNKIIITKMKIRKERKLKNNTDKNKLITELNSLKSEQSKYYELTGKKKIIDFKQEIVKLKSKKSPSKTNDIKIKLKEYKQEYINSIVLWKYTIPARVHHFSKMVGIENYLKRKPSALSGGQRQRVALVRAISKDAGLFLFDEPLSNLDAKLRGTMRSEIRRLHEELNSSSVFVTHDQVEAMSMSDKIVLMNKGYIQQIGTPSELFNDPSNIFVADFIGNPGINIIDATCINGNTIQIKSRKIRLAKKNSEIQKKIITYKNEKVILGIRPQNIITDPTIIANSKDNILNVKVMSIETIGHENIIVTSSDILGDNFRILANRYLMPKKGEIIKIIINPNTIQIFDRKTGFTINSIPNEETAAAREVWINSESERIKNQVVAQSEKSKEKISHKIAKDAFGVVNKKYGKLRKEKKNKLKNNKFEDITLINQIKDKGGN